MFRCWIFLIRGKAGREPLVIITCKHAGSVLVHLQLPVLTFHPAFVLNFGKYPFPFGWECWIFIYSSRPPFSLSRTTGDVFAAFLVPLHFVLDFYYLVIGSAVPTRPHNPFFRTFITLRVRTWEKTTDLNSLRCVVSCSVGLKAGELPTWPGLAPKSWVLAEFFFFSLPELKSKHCQGLEMLHC